jgi:FkbM family methyltransferase
MFLREGSSDFAVYSSSIWCGDYSGLDELLYGIEETIRFCVDAGSNIGTTSVLLAEKFLMTKIVSLEADQGNFAVLTANIAESHLSNIVCIHAALWGRHEDLYLSSSEREWAHQVQQADSTSNTSHVKAITVPDLLDMAPNGIIDILKIDIEGAEDNLFLASTSADPKEWPSNVRYIAIEIHGNRLDLQIKALLRRAGFSLFQTGETTYPRNTLLESVNYIASSSQ